MTIREALKKYSTIEADLLLAHVLNKSREFLYLHPEVELSRTHKKQLDKVVKRRINGEPVAYVVGYKDFFGLRFKVSKDTLIPRPETEWLVDRALGIIATAKKRGVKVLDVGTGSGCIAISIAKNTKQASITASDVSNKALRVAKQNSRTHKASIKFIKSNLLNKISGKYNVIIANLPYVPYSSYKKLKANLKYEPIMALTDKTDGYVLYKKLLKDVKKNLAPSSSILLEMDPGTKPLLSLWLKEYLPNAQIVFYKDFKKLERYAEIKPKISPGFL